MTGPVLPPEVNRKGIAAPWVKTGFVQVEVVGGSPDPLLPVRRPVLSVTCWTTVLGSNRPPWDQAYAMGSAILKATWDRHTINRLLTPVINGVAYEPAQVQGAKMLTQFRRGYSDVADFANVTADLWLSWIAVGDRIN